MAFFTFRQLAIEASQSMGPVGSATTRRVGEAWRRVRREGGNGCGLVLQEGLHAPGKRSQQTAV